MTITEHHRLPPAAVARASSDDSEAVARIKATVCSGHLREVDVMWVDHQGHARGKRISATSFLDRARGPGFAFCNAALAWDVAGDVKSELRHADWDTGFPDFFAVPDLGSFRELPVRERTGDVISDLVDHHGQLVAASPRSVLPHDRAPCRAGVHGEGRRRDRVPPAVARWQAARRRSAGVLAAGAQRDRAGIRPAAGRPARVRRG